MSLDQKEQDFNDDMNGQTSSGYTIFVQFPEELAFEDDENIHVRGFRRSKWGGDYAEDAEGPSVLEEKSKNAIAAAMRTIQQMAVETEIMRKGIPGGFQPRSIRLKFGVQFDFKVGAILAESGASSAIEVELEWARHSDDVLRVLRAETDVDRALTASVDDVEPST